MKRSIFLITLFWLSSFVPCAHATGRRVALVIGNSAYAHVPHLPHAGNDAVALSGALEKLGFEVLLGQDLDKEATERMLQAFGERLSGASLGVFFYAGHGLQVSGQNYLVPIDATLFSASTLDFETLRLDTVQRVMEQQTRTNVLFIDACRDDALGRNLAQSFGTRSTAVGRGLAAMEAGAGTLISFSTQPGNVASDGDDKHSPFAAALIRHVGKPDLDISSILIDVRKDVVTATDHKQVPWENSSLTSRVYFGAPGIQPSEPQQEPQVKPEASKAVPVPFSGNWKVSRTSANCTFTHVSFFLTIGEEGAISGSTGFGARLEGSVTSDGNIIFRHPGTGKGKKFDGSTVTYAGSVDAKSGRGTFYKGENCSGRITLAKVN